MLIAGRAIAGLGASGISTGCYTIVAYTAPPQLRPAFTGIMGATFGAGSVVGPLLGGALRVVSLGDGGKCLHVFCLGLANTFKFLHQSTHWCSINHCYPALVQDAVNSATFESFIAREILADGLQRNLLDYGSHNLLSSRHGMERYYQSLELSFCDCRIGSLPCVDFCLHIE